MAIPKPNATDSSRDAATCDRPVRRCLPAAQMGRQSVQIDTTRPDGSRPPREWHSSTAGPDTTLHPASVRQTLRPSWRTAELPAPFARFPVPAMQLVAFESDVERLA